MSAELNSFCINISENGGKLEYSVYPTDEAGKPILTSPMYGPTELQPNGGLSGIKSNLTEMFTKHISSLPRVYEERYKHKISTILQENASNFGRSAQGAAATFVNAPGKGLSAARNYLSKGQSVGIEPQVENPASFETNPLVDNSQSLEKTLPPATGMAQGTMTNNTSMVGGPPNPPNASGGTRRKRIKKSRKSRKHRINIAI